MKATTDSDRRKDVHHSESGEHETERDSLDGREVDVPPPEQRVDPVVHQWNDDDDGDTVEVEEKIVGRSVGRL